MPGGTSLAFLMFALIAGHTAAVMAMLVVPSVAPAVARDYGVDPSLVGYQIAFVSLGQVVSLMLLGNFSRKFGACRAYQIGHGAIAAGMLLMVIPSKALLIASSVVIGMGHGLLSPSSTSLLMRFAPAKSRNLLFSLQQTGVPFGGILAALIAPAIAVTVGWRWALIVIAVLLIAMAATMQRGRGGWDTDRDPAAPAVAANPLAGLMAIWRDRPLRLMSLVGGAFCWGQFVVISYTVVAAVAELGMSLVVAGTLLTAVHVGSAAGRVVAGGIADRAGGKRVLTCLGWVLLATSAITLWMGPGWPAILLYALFTLSGIVTGAWAGLMLAELGRLAPHGHVGSTLSGAMIYVNGGKFLGPVVFANVYALTHSYSVCFASLAIPAALALYCLAKIPGRPTQSTEGRSPA
jgi:predicted MFS family arabinose efflux permease